MENIENTKEEAKIEAFDINCRFCNKKLGEYSSAVGNVDFEDTRCDECEKNFGNYKEMHDRYMVAGGSFDAFKALMEKNDHKNTGFDAEIAKIK